MSTEFKSNTNEYERELLKVNCELPKINFEPPKIGCEHIKSVVKRVRSESNTLLSGLLDIIDNVYGLAFKLKEEGLLKNHITEADIRLIYSELNNDELVKIIISDNILHGFKSILEGGINSPLNMGHLRDGHKDDNESSEFGNGLKKAIMYLCNNANIYTRSITDDGRENYVKVKFNIETMMSQCKPEESYDPKFKLITSDEFKENHHNNFSHGSTICLTELRLDSILHDPESSDKFSKEDLENYLMENLSITYSNIIKTKVFSITLNGKKVNPNTDLTEMIPEHTRYRLYIKLNTTGDVVQIYRKGKTPTGKPQYSEYTDKGQNEDNEQNEDKNKQKYKFKHNIKDSDFESFTLDPYVFTLEMISLTTCGTHYSNIFHYDRTYVSRNGRQFYPFIKITKQESDGYSNHIYNRVEYISKRLNKFIGVGSNKQLTKSNNLLMSAIHLTQKETTTKFRARARAAAAAAAASKKENQTNVQNNVQPEIQNNVQPEIIPVQIDTYKKGKSNFKSQFNPQIQEIQFEEIQPEETQTEIQPKEIQTEIQTEIQIEIQIEESQIEIQPEEIQIEEPQIVTDNIINVIQENEAIVIINNQQNNINLATNKIHDNLVDESKEKLRSASQIIMELIADPDFDRNDGYKVLEFINMYVSNK